MLIMNTTAPRFNGILKKWTADRGFGFLVPDQGGQELFVHVSAFARDGRVPTVGEALSFEVEPDKEGRKRAVRVRRPGDVAAKPARVAGQGHSHSHRRAPSPSRSETNSSWFWLILGVLLVAALGWYGYGHYSARTEATQQRLVNPVATEVPWPAPVAAAKTSFVCDGREYCSQMTSCAEAKEFLKNCPGAKMDGNGDGVPCEQQWCTGPFGN